MSVSLLVITHNQIGREIIDTAISILGNKPQQIEFISVPSILLPDDLGSYADQIRDTISRLQSEQGILILTDIYGATPNNLARYFASDIKVRIIAGLSLPMLLRVLNYREQTLDELLSTAIEGGQNGIVVGI